MSDFTRGSMLVVAIAAALLASACTAGGVSPSAALLSTSVPTTAASAATVATLAPTSGPTSAPTLPPSGQLAPGTYRSDFITYTLPAGWSAYQSWGANKDDGNPPNGMFIAPWRNIATVYKDPCHWQTTGASVGATVADEVAALLAQKQGRSTVTPIDVTVDGFRGKQVNLMVPVGINFAACDEATYKEFTDASGGDRYNQGPGQHDLLDILDVSGQTLVIDRVFYPANTAADLAELQAIFDSIKITS